MCEVYTLIPNPLCLICFEDPREMHQTREPGMTFVRNTVLKPIVVIRTGSFLRKGSFLKKKWKSIKF